MQQFFSKILKKKKTIFFVFLFVIIFSFSLPHIVFSAQQTPIQQAAALLNQTPDNAPGAKFSTLSLKDVGLAFALAIPEAVIRGSYVIAAYSNYLLTYVLTFYLSKAITTDPDFIGAWGQMRDLANMLIVLGFVVVGIATALRIREYEAKKLLWPLILVALLINFSSLFCGLIIDASNMVTTGLAVGGSPGQAILANLVNSGRQILTDDESIAYVTYFTMLCFVYSAIYLGVAFTFLYLAAILIARYVILIMLFILSPLAFAFWVYPASKHLWTEWWNAFIKWSFVGVFGSFVLYVCSPLVKKISAAAAASLEEFICISVIILLFLYVGFKMTSKQTGIAAMAGKAVMGLATGGAGFVAGAVGSVAAGGAKASGLAGLAQRGGQAVKDRTTAAGEKLGLVNKGTTTANKAGRLAEPTKRLEQIADNDKLAKIAEQRPITAQQSADKAAAATILAKRGAFNAVNPSKRDAVAAHAAAFGVAKDTFTKAAPEVMAAATDKEATEKVRNDRAIKEIKDKNLYPDSIAAQETLDRYKKQPVTPNEIKQAKVQLRQQKVTENALGVSPVADGDINNKLIENEQKRLIQAATRRGEVLPAEEALKEASKYKATEAERAVTRESLGQERIQKAIEKMSPSKSSELPVEAVNAQTIGHFSANQLTGVTGIKERGSKGLVEKVSKFKDKSSDEYKQLQSLIDSTTDPKEQDRLMRTFITIDDNF